MGHHPTWALLPSFCKYQLVLCHLVSWDRTIFQTRTGVKVISFATCRKFTGLPSRLWVDSFQFYKVQTPQQWLSVLEPEPFLCLCRLLLLKAYQMCVEQLSGGVKRSQGESCSLWLGRVLPLPFKVNHLWRGEWLLVNPKSETAHPSPVFASSESRKVAFVIVGIFPKNCVHLSCHWTIYLLMNG